MDESYILFNASYDIECDTCPNCGQLSHSVKEYKYVYPIIGKIEREWFESLPRLIDEEFLKCWPDRWVMVILRI